MLTDDLMLRIGWTLLPCAAGAVLLAVFIALKIKKRLIKAVLVKGALSVMFVAAAGACVNRIGSNPIYAVLVICGLLFGLLGDIWLDFKYIFPEHNGTFTRAGFAVFGIGHIFYIAALLLGFPAYRSGRYGSVIVPVLLAVLISVGNIALEKPMKLRYGGMKPYVLVYGALLFSTALLAGAMAYMSGWQDTALDIQ